MLLMISAAALAASPGPAAAVAASTAPTYSTIGTRAFLRIERAVAVTADEWRNAPPTQKRRERLVLDERGDIQLQRVIEFE